MKLLKVPKKNRKWWTLYSISACLAMINFNSTAIIVILPKLYQDLGLSQVAQQWTINIYLLFLGMLMIAGGRISDLIGNRRAFFIGMGGFLLASLCCSLAIGENSLLFSRALQGIFGALLAPNTAVVILKAFPKYERGTAIGIYAGIAASFLALGPLVGGFCAQFLSWRYIFLLNLPLGALSVFIALRTIPRLKKKITRIKIDWLGLLLLMITTSTLLIAIMEGVNFGWSSSFIIRLFIVSIISCGLFILVEQKSKQPLVDFTILREKNYLFTCIIIMFVEIGIISRTFWILFFQFGFACSPFKAGLLIIPSVILGMVFAPISGRLVDRYGSRWPVAIGLILLIIGLLWISWFANAFNYSQVIFGTILSGAGLAMTSNMSAVALVNIPDENKGIAYATYQQIRQISGTLGGAIVGAIIINLNTQCFHKSLANLNITANNIPIDKFLTLATRNSDKNLSGIPENMLPIIHKIAIVAYAKSFSLSMLLIAIFAIVGLYLSITKLSNRPRSITTI